MSVIGCAERTLSQLSCFFRPILNFNLRDNTYIFVNLQSCVPDPYIFGYVNLDCGAGYGRPVMDNEKNVLLVTPGSKQYVFTF